MPKNTNAAGERQNTEVARLLNEYRAILQNNDHMISGLEVMQKIPDVLAVELERGIHREKLVVKGLRKGAWCDVGVRAYKKVNGKKCWSESAYSKKVMKIK